MSKNIFDHGGVPTLRISKLEDISDLVLIDVRRDEEFTGELGHIEGAKLVTLGPELEDYLASADKSKPTLFICRSGARSANATMFAQNLGFEAVYNMEGGMMYWNELGLPVKK
jgi:hydroxyacylglutathione hydrolase